MWLHICFCLNPHQDLSKNAAFFDFLLYKSVLHSSTAVLWFTQSSGLSAGALLLCVQHPGKSTWGQWSIGHSYYRGLIFFSSRIISFADIIWAQSKPCRTFSIMSSRACSWPAAHRCVCDFGSGPPSPNRALWNAFHKRKHFCNLGRGFNKWRWEL